MLLSFLTILLHIFTSCVDYITLLLVLETITTVYFFFFLKNSYSSTFTLLRYKNLISQYL